MAKSLTIPGVGAFLKDEIGKKFDGDYDMLWETARDKEFPNQGRLRGLVASALRDMNSIASMDEIEEVPLLQVALPVGFEEWDGETPILVAYTPLTVNDVDVKEIYAYDSSGEEHVLDGQEPPDYPVMVVGINERVNLAGSLGKGLDMEPDPPGDGDGGGPGTPTIRITQIDLDRDAWYYEPWMLGDAELYFRVYDTELADQTNINVADLFWALGQYAPVGGYKSYQCWKWEIYHYVQDKPWRTINLNTGWETHGSFSFDYFRAYTLRLMEYDFPFYDGGANNICDWIGMGIVAAVIASGQMAGAVSFDVLLAALYGGLVYWVICDQLVLNDDEIGEKNNFQSIVSTARAHLGTVYEWGNSAYQIRFKVE